jgi:hypothetical protein
MTPLGCWPRGRHMIAGERCAPGIVEFIDSKVEEETKAQVLIEQGYDHSIDGRTTTRSDQAEGFEVVRGFGEGAGAYC